MSTTSNTINNQQQRYSTAGPTHTSPPYHLSHSADHAEQQSPRQRKQNMAELKLRRLNELNQRLQEDLNRRRIPVSEAAMDLIAFTDKEPKDFMVPSRWGAVDKRDDPYAPQQSGGCCSVM